MTTADSLRGHDWLPDSDFLATIPDLYKTEAMPLTDKIVWIHYFVGACDWFVMEFDPTTGIAFGWVDLGDPSNAELGYFSLPELRGIVANGAFVVERDLHFSPTKFSDLGRRGAFRP